MLLEEVNHRINRLSRDFLVVQWLRLCTSTSGGWSLIPGLKTRILPAHSAAKLWRGLGGNTVSKVHCPLQCGWTSSNPQRAQIQKKKEEQGEVAGWAGPWICTQHSWCSSLQTSTCIFSISHLALKPWSHTTYFLGLCLQKAGHKSVQLPSSHESIAYNKHKHAPPIEFLSLGTLE